VLTDRRLITSWRLRKPVVVRAELDTLLPPETQGSMIITRPAQPPASRRRGDLKPGMVGGQNVPASPRQLITPFLDGR